MKSITYIAGLLLFSIIISCKTDVDNKSTAALKIETSAEAPQPSQTSTKADLIIDEAIAAHGGDLYKQANYSFVFRGKTYRFINNNDQFTYSVESIKGDNKTEDFLINGAFERRVNGELKTLSQKNINKYIEALNSVVYFAILPYKLSDAAVNKAYVETTTIKGQTYDVIQITFDQEGGGKDYDDEFHYWINTQTKKVDYLAYSYITGEKGVRFRTAYNPRVVDGITFQDYVNYKASWGTPLKDLPAMYEKGELKELSKIITENVTNLKK